MNYGHFAGRLGRDAELRATPSGQSVANFVIAVDTGWGDNKKTLWVDCALWGDRAEKLTQYLTKGKAVSVSGDVDLRTYEKKDGSGGASITCNVQRVTLQGGGSSGEPAAEAEKPYDWNKARETARPTAPVAAAAGAEPFNDDIPF
jgi:single-strand DNA-binding protein